MTTFHAFMNPATHRDTTPAPLLFLFLIPMLAVVGLIVWLASGPTWGLVVAALVAVVLFTAVIVAVVARRLDDEDDDRY
jgi:membrane protein implicated in regulation of membrane protease activity